MPQIGQVEEYTNPIDGLRPSDKGIEGAVQEGRRVGLFFNQIGSDLGRDVNQLGTLYQKHQDYQTERAWSDATTGIIGSYTTGESAYLSQPDPNAPGHTIGERPGAALAYHSQVADQIEQVYDHAARVATPELQTRLREHANELKLSLQRSSLATQSRLDATASAKSLDQGVNNLASGAFSGLPLDGVLSQLQTTVTGATSVIQDYDERQKATETAMKAGQWRVVRAAIDGMTLQGGQEGIDSARKLLADPKYQDIIGQNPGALEALVDNRQNQLDAAKNRAITQQARIDELQGRVEADRIFKSFYTAPDGSTMATPIIPPDIDARIIMNPRLPYNQKQEMLSAVNSLVQRGQRQDSQAAIADYAVAIANHVPISDTDWKTLAEQAPNFYMHEMERLSRNGPEEKQLNELKKTEYATIKSVFTGGNPVTRPAQLVPYNQVVAAVEDQLSRMSPQDQVAAMTRGNPNFIITPHLLRAAGARPDNIIDELQGTVGFTRRAGESIGDWRQDQFYQQNATRYKNRGAGLDEAWKKFTNDHPDWSTNPGALGNLPALGRGQHAFPTQGLSRREAIAATLDGLR